MKRIVSLTALFIALLTTISFADWKYDELGKWYERKDGSYPKSCVEIIDGKPCGFDEEGYMSWCVEDIGGTNFKLSYIKTATGKRVLAGMELYNANEGNYDSSTGAVDMSKYDQLRIEKYETERIVLHGVNAKGENVIKAFNVKIPVVTGYNSDKINRALNMQTGKIVENYLIYNHDFSNEEKKRDDGVSSLLNDGASLQLGNGYLTFKFKTWGNKNITLKYDLATDALTLVQ